MQDEAIRRVISWNYKHKGNPMVLAFDTLTGEVFLPCIKQWCEQPVATALGYIQQASLATQKPEKKLKFGAPQGANGFVKSSTYRGKAVGRYI